MIESPNFSCILSFDIEEHHRIEAAYGLEIPADRRADYSNRMEATTRRILERLASFQARATFFIVGEIAESHPKLVRDIAEAGHEIGSHSHDHRRVNRFTPGTFAEDLRVSKDRLEQVGRQSVTGFRAPTFSVTRATAWAIDALNEVGFTVSGKVAVNGALPIRGTYCTANPTSLYEVAKVTFTDAAKGYSTTLKIFCNTPDF